jgi:hypothetical protein
MACSNTPGAVQLGVERGLHACSQRLQQRCGRYAGEYTHLGERVMEFFGFDRGSRVEYVGGLDEQGAPHGLGVWYDACSKGELLMGCAPTAAAPRLWFWRMHAAPTASLLLHGCCLATKQRVASKGVRQRPHMSVALWQHHQPCT